MWTSFFVFWNCISRKLFFEILRSCYARLAMSVKKDKICVCFDNMCVSYDKLCVICNKIEFITNITYVTEIHTFYFYNNKHTSTTINTKFTVKYIFYQNQHWSIMDLSVSLGAFLWLNFKSNMPFYYYISILNFWDIIMLYRFDNIFQIIREYLINCEKNIILS